MQLGAYRLISRIGAGGMGEVWRAEDTFLLRAAAVKVLPEWVSSDEEARERFLREGRTAAQLNHPYITTIYTVGEEAGTMYIAMELVQGVLLSEAIANGLRVPDAVRIVRQTAEGLAAAHACSIVHRDIKPENVMVQPSGVKILDFGIAKHYGTSEAGTLTVGGMVLGTPHYMSPEQALGQPLDARSDLFSLGSVLFEALTGRCPFVAPTVTETLLKIASTVAPDPREIVPSIPEDLVCIVRKALHHRRESRFQTAEEFACALGGQASRLPLAGILPGSTANETSAAIVGRALIAGEDADTTACLRKVLTAHGIVCDEARSGSAAIQLLRQRAYGLAFVDLYLPRIDGWGVVDFIRRRRYSDDLRVFVVTNGKPARFSNVDREAIAGVLSKPLDAVCVERAIAES